LISQWLLGHSFSVTVWVGYIACFGMATSTGIIMMVYLRQAIENAGGLEQLDYEGLRRAVVDGAATRLRPKLLTEGTTVLALAPMLWASGVGAEVIRPMAAPVLGGILFADEVIDLLIPILFHAIRRRRLARIRGEASTADLQSPHHEPSGEAGSDDSARAERRETEILGKRG
jgi:Cu(I)/Ag(I) efflux system membrane protein CusA/SilA